MPSADVKNGVKRRLNLNPDEALHAVTVAVHFNERLFSTSQQHDPI
jgi:hypothetical protein